MTTAQNQPTPTSSKALNISLWVVQVLMFAAFCFFGYLKLFMTPEALVAMWHTQWPLEHTGLLRFTGLVDIAGGLGLLLPSLTRIKPKLTVLAAIGCMVLQVLAIGFHAKRGEFAALPLNFILLPLVAFIFWGRHKKAPITDKI